MASGHGLIQETGANIKTFGVTSEILSVEDLYGVLGTSQACSAYELRRCYLERSKICHPDKLPYHPQSTSAFQRLGFAFEVLRSPCSRRTYDRTSKPPNPFEKSNFLQGEQTFRGAVEAFLREFMRGEFAIVRNGLQCLSKKYPHLVSQEVVFWVEKSFVKMRELVLTAKTYTLLIYAELGRLHRVQRRLRNLRLLDVMGRMKLTVHLVRVALAIPMRVDRALKQKEEEELMAKIASLQATGLPPDVYKRAGILNERVSRVLEFIVGDAGFDEESDEMDEINEPVKSASK